MSKYIIVLEFDNNLYFRGGCDSFQEAKASADKEFERENEYPEEVPQYLRNRLKKLTGMPIKENTIYEGNCNHCISNEFMAIYVYDASLQKQTISEFVKARDKHSKPLSQEVIELRAKSNIKPDLTFSLDISGTGKIQCEDCGHTEDVTGGLHFPGSSKAVLGFQCQSCGKFKVLNFPVDKNLMKCDCGGDLSRDESVFCPECKSKKLSYDMDFIT